MLNNALISALQKVYPPERLLQRAVQLAPYESDALTAFRARPAAVVLPESQEEVIETVKLCHQFDVPFVHGLAGQVSPVAHCPSMKES